jgi:uncharacterized membrane protein
MATTTLGFGAILVLIGVVGYLASGRASPTALIPAVIGAVLVLCGVLARKESMRKHAIHAALVVALLALLGTAGGVVKLIRWGLGTAPERPMAVAAQAVTAALCVGFIVLGIRSFRAARKAREVAAG